MGTWCVKNNKGQEILCHCAHGSKPFDYLETVLGLEKRGWLPKGVYSSEEEVKRLGGWCNDFSHGHYQLPTLNGVVVPDGTFEKMGIDYQGEPIELKNDK